MEPAWLGWPELAELADTELPRTSKRPRVDHVDDDLHEGPLTQPRRAGDTENLSTGRTTGNMAVSAKHRGHRGPRWPELAELTGSAALADAPRTSKRLRVDHVGDDVHDGTLTQPRRVGDPPTGNSAIGAKRRAREGPGSCCQQCGRMTTSTTGHGGARPQCAAAQGRDAVQRLLPKAGVLRFPH